MTNERITPKQICEWAHWIPFPARIGDYHHSAIAWKMGTDPDVAEFTVTLMKMDHYSVSTVSDQHGSMTHIERDTIEETVELAYKTIAAWVNDRRRIPDKSVEIEVAHRANRVAIGAAPLPQDPQP